MATTTIDSDTELSAVNSILGSIGQAPITTLNFTNPEIAFIYNILAEVNKDVQNEGWHFNTEEHVHQDKGTNIPIPSTYLRFDVHDGQGDRTLDVVQRDGKLYDKVNHTFTFDDDLLMDITYLLTFEDIPSVFQRYVISRAASRAAAQLVSNPQLVQLLQTQEAQARASCIEYDTQQGDHNYLGLNHNVANYQTYQPFRALIR
jgi:hypothetical protein